MLEEVLTVPNRKHNLVLRIGQERIRPRTACEDIAPCSPSELVIALTAHQYVVPIITPQGIVTGIA
jgi:hypothetical protein